MMLPDTKVQELVAQAFASHSLCGCDSVGHALAGAAYEIIATEIASNKQANKVWNSAGEANTRHVQSAFWRALWAAKEAGLTRLVPAVNPDGPEQCFDCPTHCHEDTGLVDHDEDTCPDCTCKGLRRTADGDELVCLCCGKRYTPGQVSETDAAGIGYRRADPDVDEVLA